jgi:hypothetical protein
LSVLLCSSICNLVLTLSRLSLLGGIDRQGKVNLRAGRGTEWCETGRRRGKRRNSKRGGIFKRGKTIDCQSYTQRLQYQQAQHKTLGRLKADRWKIDYERTREERETLPNFPSPKSLNY